MIILDASVIIKWFKPDEKSDEADQFLKDHLSGGNSIFVPTLLIYEITNALWYSKLLTPNEIENALNILESLKINYINPDKSLMQEALRVSETTKLSVYDASYVILAKRFSCSLITADAKLYQRAKATAEIILL